MILPPTSFIIHWKTFWGVQIFIWFMATLGLWIGTAIPGIGIAFFITGLMIWLGAGIALEWTGTFAYHEFGATPTGPIGYVLMGVLIALIAALIAWFVQSLITRRRRGR